MKKLLFLLLFIPTLVFGQFKGLTYGGKAMLYGDKAAGAGEFPPTGLGDIYYVSTSGDDAKDGLSEVNAWATLAYAETNAPTGATIALKRGDTWALDNVLEINQGGVPGDYTTWDGALWGTGDTATIQSNSDGGASPKYRALVHVAGCSYVTFQNIRIDGNDTKRHGIVVGSTNNNSVGVGPTAQNNEHDIIIQNCNVYDIGDGSDYEIGILVQSWYNDIWNITVRGNTVNKVSSHAISFYPYRTDLGSDGELTSTINSYIGYNTCTNFREYGGNVGYGIHVNNEQRGITVEHNTISTGSSANHGHGIMIESNEPTPGWFPTDAVIRYNKSTIETSCAIQVQGGEAQTMQIYGNLFRTTDMSADTYVFRISSAGANGYLGASIEAYNNVFISGASDSYHWPVYDQSATEGVFTFKNNINYSETTSAYAYCLRVDQANSIVHSNNLYYHAGVGDYNLVRIVSTYYKDSDISGWEATAVTTDPAFTSEFDDLHLRTGSPALNAGIIIPGISQYDFDGVAWGANPWNMGAYETTVDP